MQTKSAVGLLVHNYRAVLQKCFWTNAKNRQDALKSLSAKVNRSTFAGLLLAAMSLVAVPVVAGTISVDSDPVVTGNTLSEVKDSLAGNTATLFGNVSQSEMITFEDDTILTLKSNVTGVVRTITMSESVTDSGAFFEHTAEDKTLTLNLSDVKFVGGKGKGFLNNQGDAYYYGGAIYSKGHVELNSSNALFENNEARSGGVIYSDTSVTLSGTNTFTSNSTDGYGGAIFGSTVTLSGTNTFTENEASMVGGAIASATSVTLSGTNTFIANEASMAGGAIFAAESVTLSGTNTFTSNTADSNGGAIFATESVTLSGSNTFTSNTADSNGGAIASRTVTLSGTNTFTSNTADSNGGAILGGTVTLSGTNEFKENMAREGGAISGGTVTLSGTNTFTSNSADNYGGAIAGYNSVTLSGTNTFTSNSADNYGGAIYSATSVTLSGTNTFIGNEAGVGGVIFGETVTLSGTNEFKENMAKEGGAIYSATSVTLSGTNTFSSNTTDSEGGAILGSNSVTLSGTNTFTENKASIIGGAIFGNTVTLSGTNTFIGNEAVSGGAIMGYNSVTLSGTNTFTSNSADGYGGAIAIQGNVIFFGDESKATFTGNTANSKANDIYTTGNVIFGGKGTYSLDGGIITENASNADQGHLIIGYDAEGNAAGLTYVTFEEGSATTLGGNLKIGNHSFLTIEGGPDTTFEVVKVEDDGSSLIKFVHDKDQAGEVLIGDASEVNSMIHVALTDGENHDIALAEKSADGITTKVVAGDNTFNVIRDGEIKGSSATLEGDYTNNVTIESGDVIYVTADGKAKGAIAFDSDATLNIFSNTTDTRTIAMSESVTDSGAFFEQTAEDKTLTLNLSDVKFVGGKGKGILNSQGDTYYYGGAIYSKGHVELNSSNASFENNEARNGGVIYSDTSVTLSGTNTFTENKASIIGGAIWTQGEVTLSGTNTFIGNEARSGGAIFGRTVTLSGTNTFTSNTTDQEGGAITSSNSVTLSGTNTFTSNTTDGYGGAIAGANSVTLSGTNTFIGNEARSGGAIFGRTVTLSGTNTFTSNTTDQEGGAIFGKTVTLSGTNTFTSNSADGHGGAILIQGNVIFFGDESKATFTGNTAAGKANDIFTTGNVIFGGKGTYSFDGGIVTTDNDMGNLYVGFDFDNSTGGLGVANGGTKVIFEKGAINDIVGITQISGEGTHVRFNNADNKLKGGLTVNNKAKLTVAGVITVEQSANFEDVTLEIAFDETFGKLDLTQAKSITFSNVSIDLVNIEGKTLTVTNDVSKALANGGIVVVDCAEGDETFKDFTTIDEGGFEIAHENGDLVVSLSTTTSGTNKVADEYNSASAQGAAIRSIMNHHDLIATTISDHIMSNIANNNHIGMVVLDETGMMASTSGIGSIATQDETGAFSVWGEALYSYAEYDGCTEMLASRESSVGGLLGFEQAYSDVHYGLFVGAISSNIDGENSSDLESEAIYGGVYMGVHYGMFIANFGAMAGYAMNDASRLGAAGEITGEYDSYMGNVFGEVGAYIELTERLYTQATVGLQYTYVNSEDYNEEGNLANHVDSNDFESLNVSVDARLGYKMADGFIEARAGLAFELLETSINSHFSLLDNPAVMFSAQGAELDSMKLILGVDAGYYLSDNVELRGGILGEIGDESERVTGNVRLIYTF